MLNTNNARDPQADFEPVEELSLDDAQIVNGIEARQFRRRIAGDRLKAKWAIITLYQRGEYDANEALFWLGTLGFVSFTRYPDYPDAILGAYIAKERWLASVGAEPDPTPPAAPRARIGPDPELLEVLAKGRAA